MESIVEIYNQWIEPVTAVVGAAAVVATATPTKKDNTVVGWLQGLIHFMAFNFGNAKNKD